MITALLMIIIILFLGYVLTLNSEVVTKTIELKNIGSRWIAVTVNKRPMFFKFVNTRTRDIFFGMLVKTVIENPNIQDYEKFDEALFSGIDDAIKLNEKLK